MSLATELGGFAAVPRKPMLSPASRFRLTYAITPPSQTTPVERRKVIAATQSARIAALPVDAVLVYDLQDETSRNAANRPFPFVPKVDALTYAYDELQVGEIPRVVYRAVADQEGSSLKQWLTRLQTERGLAVFVGAPSSKRSVALTLPQAFSLCREYSPLVSFGGVVIAERHQRSGTEDERVWEKLNHGCSFFVSQTIWSVEATIGLLRALQARSQVTGVPVPNILLTLSPCGSEQTLRFQEWLGVNVPSSIERELCQAPDMLARSVELATQVFAEIQAFARSQRITIGCNVESVSTRAIEVEASLELIRRVAELQAASTRYESAHCDRDAHQAGAGAP